MTVDGGRYGLSSTAYGLKIKSSRPQWDGREFPAVPPTFIALSMVEGQRALRRQSSASQ